MRPKIIMDAATLINMYEYTWLVFVSSKKKQLEQRVHSHPDQYAYCMHATLIGMDATISN
jgi:hypothetical protein